MVKMRLSQVMFMDHLLTAGRTIENFAIELTNAFELVRKELPQNAFSIQQEGNRKILQGWDYLLAHTAYDSSAVTLYYADKIITATFSAEPKQIFLVHSVKEPYALAHLNVVLEKPTRVDKMLLEDVAAMASTGHRCIYSSSLIDKQVSEFILKYAKR